MLWKTSYSVGVNKLLRFSSYLCININDIVNTILSIKSKRLFEKYVMEASIEI